MPGWGADLSRAGVLNGARRFSSAKSLADPDRACLTYSTAEFAAKAGSSAELELLWTGRTGTTLPWPLRSFHRILARGRSLALVRDPLAIRRITELWLTVGPGRESVEFWSVRRSSVAAVIEHLQRGGIDPDELLAAEASRALLSIEARSEHRSSWWVEVRYGVQCPADLMRVFESGEDEWDEDGA
jgi:hypothetical protein